MLVIICGVPACGKTAIANKLKESLQEEGYNFGVLHSDQFRRKRYEKMIKIVEKSYRNWILDGTFYKREWIEKFRSLQDTVVVKIEASLENCLKRNRERGSRIDEKAIRIIWKEFEDPTPDLVINTDYVSLEKAVEMIKELVINKFTA